MQKSIYDVIELPEGLLEIINLAEKHPKNEDLQKIFNPMIISVARTLMKFDYEQQREQEVQKK